MNISIIEFINQANSIDKNKFSIEDHISYIDLKIFTDKEYDTSNGNDQYDMAANSLIEAHFDTLANSEVVFVNYAGNDSDKFFGLILAHHIRLDKVLRKLAILITSAEDKSSLMEYEPDLSHLLHTGGTGYFSDIEEAISKIQKFKSKISLLKLSPSIFKDGILDKLVIRQPEEQQGRHGIANQWGAYRMSQVGELMINYKFPKTLYFKYLLAQSSNPKPQKIIFPVVDKVLFIDDNFHKGWKDCLEQIFGEDKIIAYKSWEEAVVDQIPDQIEKDEFDLIILDLYFGESKDVKKETGKDILKIIKGTKERDGITTKGLNPIVPVIMFTASNKAWNMDELYEAGADGYYVKEHPETAHDPEFSVNNFKNFHENVKNCLEKGALLRKYWRKIQELKDDSISIINNKTDNNGNNQLNKERINERLIMFLGLLKKAFEQTDFDKNTFFYSEWELAFLTLWSTLNEIQECFYEKIMGFENPRGSNLFEMKHPDSSIIISGWKIKGQSDRFLWREAEYDISNTLKVINEKFGYISYSNLNYDNRNKTFKISGNLKDRDFYETRLFLQIAFLIKKDIRIRNEISEICKESVRHTNPDLPENIVENLSKNQHSFEEKKFLDSLLRMNQLRNHMYLTHGGDAANADFSKLYREQREIVNWGVDIKECFELVYFLCTGKKCDLNKKSLTPCSLPTKSNPSSTTKSS